VVATFIDGLLAHWAGDALGENGDTEPVRDGDPKVARPENGVVAIFL
jgi:hypothetical protein